MANKPIHYHLASKEAKFGKFAGKTILQAIPTARETVSFRSLCEEVSRNTTFAPEEVQAVINLTTKIAKHHVENGEGVELGDLGRLSPSFKSVQVERGKGEDGDKVFNANVHIVRPVARFSPSRKYFELRGVSFERVYPKSVRVGKPHGGASEPGGAVSSGDTHGSGEGHSL